MESFELKLKNALRRATPMPAAEVAALNRGIVQTFARRQKGFWRLTAGYLAVMTLLILFLLALIAYTADLKQCLLYGICVLILFESTVLMKLWFWGMHSKIATLREIKLLQLTVAELRARVAPAEATLSADYADPTDGGAAMAMPTAGAVAAGKWWRIVLPPLWVLAVAGLVYWGWLWNPGEPRDVTPYFEKTVAAGDGAGKAEWEQSFEVTQGRGHFYPKVAPVGKGGRVWISVGPEGGEAMYSGPVEPGWRISFGQPTPGRYVIKGRTEQADGGFTLRLGGVDEIPGGQTFARVFFMLLSAALAVGLPIVWLQERWLQRIDPEMGTTAAGPRGEG